MSTQDYLALVEQAYQNRGGIDFQREKLRTTSAIRIRRRMVADVVQGAVLPPVVAMRGIFQDITRQKEDAEQLDKLNRQLMGTSRLAGMAEVATGVLHNVGKRAQ